MQIWLRAASKGPVDSSKGRLASERINLSLALTSRQDDNDKANLGQFETERKLFALHSRPARDTRRLPARAAAKLIDQAARVGSACVARRLATNGVAHKPSGR